HRKCSSKKGKLPFSKSVKARGLPTIKRPVDLEKMNVLDNLDALAAASRSPDTLWQELKANISVLVTEDRTTEQHAITKAGRALSILQKNDAFRGCVSAMTGFRQAYALAYQE